MLTGVQWLCDCGKPFALAPHAFDEGMVCPACGTDVTPKDLLPHLPRDVSRGVYWQSLWILFLLTSAQLWLMGRAYHWNKPHELDTLFRDFGRSIPRTCRLALRADVVLPMLFTLEAMAVATLLWGSLRRNRDLLPSAVLLALLSITLLIGMLLAAAIRLPFLDLIKALD